LCSSAASTASGASRASVSTASRSANRRDAQAAPRWRRPAEVGQPVVEAVLPEDRRPLRWRSSSSSSRLRPGCGSRRSPAVSGPVIRATLAGMRQTSRSRTDAGTRQVSSGTTVTTARTGLGRPRRWLAEMAHQRAWVHLGSITVGSRAGYGQPESAPRTEPSSPARWATGLQLGEQSDGSGHWAWCAARPRRARAGPRQQGVRLPGSRPQPAKAEHGEQPGKGEHRPAQGTGVRPPPPCTTVRMPTTAGTAAHRDQPDDVHLPARRYPGLERRCGGDAFGGHAGTGAASTSLPTRGSAVPRAAARFGLSASRQPAGALAGARGPGRVVRAPDHLQPPRPRLRRRGPSGLRPARWLEDRAQSISSGAGPRRQPLGAPRTTRPSRAARPRPPRPLGAPSARESLRRAGRPRPSPPP
jgi:hypothetical protein